MAQRRLIAAVALLALLAWWQSRSAISTLFVGARVLTLDGRTDGREVAP